MIFAFQIFAIFGLIACGYVARKRGLISAQGTTELARLTTDLIYPALIFVSITRLSVGDLLANWALPVLVTGIAFAGLTLGLIAVRLMNPAPRATTKAFLFHCLMNNYLFLPLPLVLFIFGERGVALLVFSSVGYELILWTLGVFLFTHDTRLRDRFRELLSPPFITLLVSLLWVGARDTFHIHATGHLAALGESVLFVAQMLGQATVAIAVIVAGSRFAVLKANTMLSGRIWLVSVIRLVLVPLLLIPVIQVLPLEDTVRGILIIIAVMPSAMVSVLFSERYGGDSEFIAGGLLLTHVWALLTVPLFLAWWL